jgi:hypothetical protein
MIDFDKENYNCRLCQTDLIINHDKRFATCRKCDYALLKDGDEFWKFCVGNNIFISDIRGGVESCQISIKNHTSIIILPAALMPDITEDEVKLFISFM